MRYFIRLSYNGTNYHGWQCQPNASSVQETLNNALSVLLNSPIFCTGAGRTDTGVHAKEMFAHFDYQKVLDVHILIHKLNSFLPKDIVVYDILPVHDKAHARFDATTRTYQYFITTFKDAFLKDSSWYYHQKLDVALMNQACELLLLHTDFECFSKVNTEVATFNCSIFEAHWSQQLNTSQNHKDNFQLVFTITANRFLRNMVRSIVGTLVYVGLRKITVENFNDIILAKNRTKAGFSAPARGLYLTKINYDYIK